MNSFCKKKFYLSLSFLSSKIQSQKVVVGPVVGLTSAVSARILLEFSAPGPVSVKLIAREGKRKLEEDPVLFLDKPTVHAVAQPAAVIAFVFENLTPESEYGIEVCDALGRVLSNSGVVRTMNEVGPMGIAVCSYNAPNAQASRCKDLCERIRGNELDLVLHVGGQIYGEKLMDTAIKMMQTRRGSGLALDQEILELFRNAYRTAWSKPDMAYILGNVSNLMIPSTTDYYPSIWTREENRNPSSAVFHVAKLACQVHSEYQGNLSRDPARGDLLYTRGQHHFCMIGDTALAILDTAACKLGFHLSSPGFHKGVDCLGRWQWNELDAVLAKGGLFDRAQTLIVVSPDPVCLLGTPREKSGFELVEKFGSATWSSANHRAEQVKLLYSIREWRARRKSVRDAFFVSGLDIGGFTRIQFPDNTFIHQVTVGPIAPPPDLSLIPVLKEIISRRPSSLPAVIEGGIHFEHHHFIRGPTFVILTIVRTEATVKSDVVVIGSSSTGFSLLCGLFGSTFPSSPIIVGDCKRSKGVFSRTQSSHTIPRSGVSNSNIQYAVPRSINTGQRSYDILEDFPDTDDGGAATPSLVDRTASQSTHNFSSKNLLSGSVTSSNNNIVANNPNTPSSSNNITNNINNSAARRFQQQYNQSFPGNMPTVDIPSSPFTVSPTPTITGGTPNSAYTPSAQFQLLQQMQQQQLQQKIQTMASNTGGSISKSGDGPRGNASLFSNSINSNASGTGQVYGGSRWDD